MKDKNLWLYLKKYKLVKMGDKIFLGTPYVI